MKEERSGIFRCRRCGRVVELLNQTAVPQEENRCQEAWEELPIHTADGGKEKHVPVAVAQENGILVKVGELPHPMTQEHYIEWIEVRFGRSLHRTCLRPGEAPQAFFELPLRPDLQIRAYCNQHGLWQKES